LVRLAVYGLLSAEFSWRSLEYQWHSSSLVRKSNLYLHIFIADFPHYTGSKPISIKPLITLRERDTSRRLDDLYLQPGIPVDAEARIRAVNAYVADLLVDMSELDLVCPFRTQKAVFASAYHIIDIDKQTERYPRFCFLSGFEVYIPSTRVTSEQTDIGK
jgi:hypothetical protein